MFVYLKILWKDFLDRHHRKILLKRIYLDDRVPSSEYLDKKRFK